MAVFLYRGLLVGLFLLSSLSLAQGPDEDISPEPVVEIPELTTETFPVHVPPPNADLSEEDRELLTRIAQRLSPQVLRHSASNFSPPPSLVPEGVEYFPVEPLFDVDLAQELASVAYDENGNRIQLSAEQIAQIREEGIFMVPSKRFAGQYHLWKVSAFLVKGVKNIRATFQKHKNQGIRHLVLYFPEAVAGKNWSLRAGLRDFFGGIGLTLAEFFGRPEHEPKYTKQKALEKIQSEILEQIREEFAQQNEFVADLRVYDAELMEKASKILAQIEARRTKSFEANRQQFELELLRQSEENEAPETRAIRLERAMADVLQEGLLNEISSDPSLERLSPGLGSYLEQRMRAVQIIASVEQDLAEATEHERALIEAELRVRAPARSEDLSWRTEQVGRRVEAIQGDLKKRFYRTAVETLNEQGFLQDAFVLKRTLEILEKAGPRVLDKLLEQRVTQETHYEVPVWNGQIEVVKDANGYFVKKPHYLVVKQSWYGWKLWDAIRRTRAWGSHGFYQLLRNFNDGPLGWRVWAQKAPFYTKYDVSLKTGEVLPRASSLQQTVYSQFARLGASIERDREAYRKRPDNGLVPKQVERAFQFLWSGLGKGVGGRAALGIGYLVGTAVNTVGSALAVPVVAAGAPLASVLAWGLPPFVSYDPSAKFFSRLHFPVLRHLLVRSILEGGGQFIYGAEGTLRHLDKGAWFGGGAPLVAGARRAGDWLGRGILSAVISGVPVRNTPRIANRFGGPGIAGGYFNEVDPDVALALVLATIRKIQLDEYEGAKERELSSLRKRVDNYVSALNRFLGPVTLAVDTQSAELKAQEESKNQRREELSRVLAVERAKLKPSSDFLRGLSAPIQFTEADLLALQIKIELVIKAFYPSGVFPFVEGGEAAFWTAKKLRPGEWSPIVDSLIRDTFGPLRPIEATDQRFRVRVEDPKVRGFIDDILAGQGIDLDSHNVPEIVDDPEQSRPAREVYPSVGTSRLCEGELAHVAAELLDSRYGR